MNGRLVAWVTGAALLAACSGSDADDRPAASLTLAEVGERAAHTASTLPDGRVLVAGGCVVDGCATATDEILVVGANGRQVTRPMRMSSPRDGHTATVVAGGRVLLAGGFAGEGVGALSSVELADPHRGSVRVLAHLAQARGGHAAARLDDGRVLIVGGWIASSTYTDTTELIDPANGTVEAGPALPFAADALDAVTLRGGTVLVTGGQTAPGRATSRAAIFDSRAMSWRELQPMGTPRLKHVAVRLDDGRVLVIGGSPDDETLLATTELFDPVSERFAPGPELREPRYKLSGGAVVVGAQVVIAGGGSAVEAVDVDADRSTVLAEGDGRASFATINRIGRAGLLVVGGYDARIRLRRAAFVLPTPAR